jgi:hypothetical protein
MLTSLMSLSAALIVLMTALAAVFHALNVKKIHRRVSELEKKSIKKEELYKELSQPQGANFSAVATVAWGLALVAFVYLYFFTPDVFARVNYFRVPKMASSPIGFAAIGLLFSVLMTAVVVGTDKLPESCRCYRFLELYNFYVIDKNTKRLFVLTIPALWISIWCSAYLSTIYPDESSSVGLVAFALFLASMVVLTTPIYREFLEGLR